MEYPKKDIPLIGYKRVDEELRLPQILCDFSLANNVVHEDENFEIIWSSLTRKIQPNWTDKLKERFAEGSIAENKVIFENINGSIKSGQMTAILGPSGEL